MDDSTYHQALYVVYFGFWVCLPSIVGCGNIVHNGLELAAILGYLESEYRSCVVSFSGVTLDLCRFQILACRVAWIGI